MTEDANKALAAEAATENTALDAIEVLEADHRVAKQLFDAFEKAADADLEAKGALVRRACEVLTVHTMIEEAILYPAAHKALMGRDEIGVDEAYVEHFIAKTLIEKFDTLKPGDHGFDATFMVLSQMVRQHIDEEESGLFPELRESGVDLVRLGEEIAAEKERLMNKLDAAASRLVDDGSLIFRR
ncbi:hemerythrin domain-containing protein [Paraburkholderia phymatum]|uniref:Hemerythrin HHE cation binding domain protein n=1 Tax=Paraburkholderia phymatum (strain DSM 17167 / CIP 108236 / LMG 21445 / STM815) TaxID=391038 RepID=B2JP20_PARP8|nr:hemerythrin domain-containing protein [Paraburkholderia phymatum]ACC74573.1 Hemerythrin HHE cation binding domain protein [Paraburkholderia phymatum STM815]